MPFSVTIALTSSWGVTSKAGFATRIPVGAICCRKTWVTSRAARSSIGMRAPVAQVRSMDEVGAAT